MYGRPDMTFLTSVRLIILSSVYVVYSIANSSPQASCSPVRGWAKTSACRLQVSLSPAVLCQIVSFSIRPGRLSVVWPVSLLVFSCMFSM